MNPLTNPSPTAALEIDNEILVESLTQIFVKIDLLKNEAYSSNVVMKCADELRLLVESLCRCLTSKQMIERKLNLDAINVHKKVADGMQENAERALGLLKKCVAN